jgi:hypothetical protein
MEADRMVIMRKSAVEDATGDTQGHTNGCGNGLVTTSVVVRENRENSGSVLQLSKSWLVTTLFTTEEAKEKLT